MSEIIKTEGLHYTYQDEEGKPVVALDGVDLMIERGEFVAVLGHNGSGKSTLAGHFNAIRLPSGGTVWVDHMDTRMEENLYDVRKTCAMVFQNRGRRGCSVCAGKYGGSAGADPPPR